ncbi:MAG: 50S ribosomal protein L4 [archaeon]
MKLQILDKQGKKIKEKETKLFEEPVRQDIICKVIEAEKNWQPWSNKFRSGMDISASGNVTHRRHVWKSDRGRGLSRIPKKAFWRRGTQFSWQGAIVPSTRGGRRAHPPKGYVNDKKINKKELLKALRSALSYVADKNEIKKKYASLDKVDIDVPLIVEASVLGLKTKDFLESLKSILKELNKIAIQNKTVRAGIGKLRGRKYKKNAGLLLVIGNKEDKKVKGIEVVRVNGLTVSDLASNGARLTMFSEKAIVDLEEVLFGEKKKVDKKKKERKDIRKIKKENVKKLNEKAKKKKAKSLDKSKEDEEDA